MANVVYIHNDRPAERSDSNMKCLQWNTHDRSEDKSNMYSLQHENNLSCFHANSEAQRYCIIQRNIIF